MGPSLYVALYDMIKLEIKKVILQPKNSRVVVYFYHPTLLSESVIFTASLTFHAKDGEKWYTNFKLQARNSVDVDRELERRVEVQLIRIFSPYFNSLMRGDGLW
jgi:hypothetical protein